MTAVTGPTPAAAVARDGEVVLRVDRVRKSYGAVRALRGASFQVRAGEILGLVGDNGAGKSTLLKVLSGVIVPDAGTISLEGTPVRFHNPAAARALGVETMYQDLALVEGFDVTSNFFLGRELYRGGLLRPLRIARRTEMRQQAAAALEDLGIRIPGFYRSTVGEMSGGQRQAVALARAAFWRGKVLLLDEPTAALGVRETREVLRVIADLAHHHRLAVVLVSHDMQQVEDLCHRVLVLRQGRMVAQLESSATDLEEIVGHITGARPAQPGLAQDDESNGSGW